MSCGGCFEFLVGAIGGSAIGAYRSDDIRPIYDQVYDKIKVVKVLFYGDFWERFVEVGGGDHRAPRWSDMVVLTGSGYVGTAGDVMLLISAGTDVLVSKISQSCSSPKERAMSVMVYSLFSTSSQNLMGQAKEKIDDYQERRNVENDNYK